MCGLCDSKDDRKVDVMEIKRFCTTDDGFSVPSFQDYDGSMTKTVTKDALIDNSRAKEGSIDLAFETALSLSSVGSILSL